MRFQTKPCIINCADPALRLKSGFTGLVFYELCEINSNKSLSWFPFSFGRFRIRFMLLSLEWYHDRFYQYYQFLGLLRNYDWDLSSWIFQRKLNFFNLDFSKNSIFRTWAMWKLRHLNHQLNIELPVNPYWFALSHNDIISKLSSYQTVSNGLVNSILLGHVRTRGKLQSHSGKPQHNFA